MSFADSPQGPIRPVVLIATVVALLVAALMLDLGERLSALLAWIDGLGFWGPLAFVVLYVIATVVMVPATGPTLIAGGLFGPFWGSVYVSIGSTIGAAAAFLISRHVARDTVARWLRGRAAFERLDRLVDERGAWIVAVTRLVPIFPYNLLNYAFGLTPISFRTYFVVSWICMIPATVLYVIGGEAIVRSIREGRLAWGRIAIVVSLSGLLVAVGIAIRKRLRSRESA